MNAYLIKPDQSVTPVTAANSKSLSLEELQRNVGGFVQRVTFKGVNVIVDNTKFTSGEMYVDEDGMAKVLPLNLKASALFGSRILGNALVNFRKGKPVETVTVFAGTKPEDRTDQNLPYALRTRPFAQKFDINGNLIKE